jgi:hypothetical protein
VGQAWLCRNKDCRKRKGFVELEEALGALARPVPCQKICKGPVVGFEVDGRLQWFRKIGKRRWREAVLRALRTGEVSKELWARRVKKRAGKLRYKGLTKRRR